MPSARHTSRLTGWAGLVGGFAGAGWGAASGPCVTVKYAWCVGTVYGQAATRTDKQ